ncbi:hypothetical protein [Jiella avicenniae]|uniref:Uncharacterized protein n=1 Tax=Jiella avicenniae TaxID=2907202 RepID=A0A9X1T5P7_9HYPH|nr:hypothetical protein [Jiella avicenniae]MCE7028435.1 hypothetical protein [Jiella avicenniae]
MTARATRRTGALTLAALLFLLGLATGNARLGAVDTADQERFTAYRGIVR